MRVHGLSTFHSGGGGVARTAPILQLPSLSCTPKCRHLEAALLEGSDELRDLSAQRSVLFQYRCNMRVFVEESTDKGKAEHLKKEEENAAPHGSCRLPDSEK